MIITLLLLILCIFLQLRFYRSPLKWGWRWKRSIMLFIKRNHSSSTNKTQTPDLVDVINLTDLPDPILDTILEKLSPEGLCRMGAVSTLLREKCISDHLWVKHMNLKWGRIIGAALSCPCPLPADSIFSRYCALENGTFWFPAQVYNRQNGHVGFLLSCYDANLCYDHRTDTFQARYPAYDMLDIPLEKNVTWDRVRTSPAKSSPYDIFDSDSMRTFRPGDHLEIQWRRSKELAYGWWYGVVGHLDSCDGNEANCHCTISDILVLEFSQYSPESRWRKTLINRRDHIEKGNEDIGFYGGIRRLESREEISTWLRLWPEQVLEGV